MANDLTVTGNTRLSWSLSEDQATAAVSRSGEAKSNRSISNGTGVNQANVGWSGRYATTGVGSVSVPIAVLPVSAFGSTGSASITTLKEILVAVTTGPTGGYVTFGMPTGATGVRVNVGGQFHWLDYQAGIPMATGSFAVANGVTGSYGFDLTVIGNGTYQ